MKYVLSKAGIGGAVQSTRASRQQAVGRKINTGQRGGNVVGQRPDGTPIYASERNRSRKKDVDGDPTSAKQRLAAAEKRIKALKAKGKDTSKVEALAASIRSKL